MKNIIAYFSEEGEFDFFETYEEAEKWLRGWYEEGFPPDTVNGHDFIAKITHRSKFIETDSKDNYKYDYEDDIPEGDEDSESWSHGSEFDVVGNLVFEAIDINTLEK